jgi:hypothetical protein
MQTPASGKYPNEQGVPSRDPLSCSLYKKTINLI